MHSGTRSIVLIVTNFFHDNSKVEVATEVMLLPSFKPAGILSNSNKCLVSRSSNMLLVDNKKNDIHVKRVNIILGIIHKSRYGQKLVEWRM